MAANAWVVYNEFKAKLGAAAVNLGTNTFKLALFLSTSNCADAALVDAHYATLTNQVASGSGYATGGATVAPSWAESGGTCTFDVADAQWTASGGNIVCRYAVLYDDSTGDKDLVAYCLLDNTPADVTVVDGTVFTIQISASGIFQLAQA